MEQPTGRKSPEAIREIRERVREVEGKRNALEQYFTEPVTVLVRDLRLSNLHVSLSPKRPMI